MIMTVLTELIKLTGEEETPKEILQKEGRTHPQSMLIRIITIDVLADPPLRIDPIPFVGDTVKSCKKNGFL